MMIGILNIASRSAVLHVVYPIGSRYLSTPRELGYQRQDLAVPLYYGSAFAAIPSRRSYQTLPLGKTKGHFTES